MDWLDRRRLIAYGWILFWLEVAMFIFLVLGTHGLIVPLAHPVTTDFVSFWAAGDQANRGAAAAVYDRTAHYAAEEAAIGAKGAPYNYFFYPPIYILLCQAVAFLPYLPSFYVWEATTGFLYLWVIRSILPPGRPILPFVAFPAVFANVGIGQNGLLTAALAGGGTRLLDSRPWLAGVLFGCMSYKPHFAILVPVALAAGGYWRSVLAAGLTVAALAGLSLLLYGRATWAAFLALSAHTGDTFATGKIPFSGLVSPYAALRMLGVPDPAALIVQGAITLGAAVIVAVCWRSRAPIAAKAMVLLAATVISVPVILIYDLLLAGVAMAWAWRDAAAGGGASRFHPWEKAVFCVVFGVSVLSRGLGASWHIPIAPLAGFGLLLLGVARIKTPANR
jgi:hypothetical protein